MSVRTCVVLLIWRWLSLHSDGRTWKIHVHIVYRYVYVGIPTRTWYCFYSSISFSRPLINRKLNPSDSTFSQGNLLDCWSSGFFWQVLYSGGRRGSSVHFSEWNRNATIYIHRKRFVNFVTFVGKMRYFSFRPSTRISKIIIQPLLQFSRCNQSSLRSWARFCRKNNFSHI